MRNEIEDGMGCAGLVPTKAEASYEDAFMRERAAYERLQKEHEDLRVRCAELERQLGMARRGQQVTCAKCGYYLPGHAIGGIDICICDD